MSILVDKSTSVLVQGMTGQQGSFHTRQMVEYGTRVVAGVTPGKGGTTVEGIPVFNGVKEAVSKTGANASVVFVPAAFAAKAMLEAAEAGLKLVVCITEGIPALDLVKVKRELGRSGVCLIGPNCPGIISPGQAKLGIMPGYIHKPGAVGVLSRSGTLTYEVVWQLTRLGLGQSTCIGIGGDSIIGMGFREGLERFAQDPDTAAVVLIGEIGGGEEERAAEYIKSSFKKPVVSFVAGLTAPEGKRMGHAGAIISQGSGRARGKMEILARSGAHVVENPAKIGEAVRDVLAKLKVKGGV